MQTVAYKYFCCNTNMWVYRFFLLFSDFISNVYVTQHNTLWEYGKMVRNSDEARIIRNGAEVLEMGSRNLSGRLKETREE